METNEAKLLESWREVVSLLGQLKEKWETHVELVHKMNIDSVHPKLQGHVIHGFNRAEFYLALPDLVEYARMRGGIEFLQIEKEKTDERREQRPTVRR